LKNYNNNCPLCNETQELKNFSWGPHIIFSCKNCGLDYCNNMDIKDIDGDSSPVHQQGIEMMAGSFHTTQKLADRLCNARLKVYEDILDHPCRNVLEVGCGPGVFHRPFSMRRVDWTGIDINPYWKKFGQQNNVPISTHPLNEVEGKFDVVIAYQVLEHVKYPMSFMALLTDRLRSGGILHLELPNHQSLTAKMRKISPLISKDYGFIQPPMHLRAYQRKTLQYLVNQLNMETKLITVCANNHPVWGQVRNWNMIQHLLYFISGTLGMGSLLVGLAQKVKT